MLREELLSVLPFVTQLRPTTPVMLFTAHSTLSWAVFRGTAEVGKQFSGSARGNRLPLPVHCHAKQEEGVGSSNKLDIDLNSSSSMELSAGWKNRLWNRVLFVGFPAKYSTEPAIKFSSWVYCSIEPRNVDAIYKFLSPPPVRQAI